MQTDHRTSAEPSVTDVRRRALALWPGIDRRKLSRTGGRPRRVARLVAHNTSLTIETIMGMLTLPPT